jgi:LacI family transcriptional regulator
VKVRHIGLMIEPLGGYRNKLLTGISRYVQQKPDWRIAFFDRERRELAELVATWQGDGIICTLADQRLRQAALRRRMPVINVAALIDEPAVVNVISDDRAVGRMGAEFFLGRGFRNFGFIRSRENLRYIANRSGGFIDRVAGEDIRAAVISLAQGSAGGELARWIARLPRPLALMATTDRLAADALEACWQLGLKVPEEIAVLGIGDSDPMCELCSPTLSSVHLDMERRGYEAAALLDRLLQGKRRPTAPVLIPPANVVERRSTDVYAFNDRNLAAALRFIRDHASRTIKVADVVAATKLSRRSLEGRFNELVGRTIHDEIWRAHFDLAQRLLTSTDLGLQEVAQRSGFRTASALVNLFRQRLGVTPKEYRVANRR